MLFFRAKQDHPTKEEQSKGSDTSQPPREIKSEFLMPSRRHHPQVEPLLATCKNLIIPKVAKYVLSLQGTIFSYKKLLALEDSWRPHASIQFPTLLFCILKNLWNPTKIQSQILLQTSFSPSFSTKLTSSSTPPFPMKIPYFHVSPISPPSKFIL